MLKLLSSAFLLVFLHCYSLELSLEDKVAQLLLVHFRGEEVNESAKKLIEEIKVGGIVYYKWANCFTGPEQVSSLSRDLQAQNKAELPLLIGVDQEGGVLSPLRKGFFSFPIARELGEKNDLLAARQCAFVMGKEMKSVGVNLNFAPVIDINVNPKNPIIGSRSFGSSPKLVTDLARQILLGYKEAGVLTSLKHYPGHGDVEVDSHKDLPLVDKTMEELKRVELIPFVELHELTDTIMTGHLLVPALDPIYCCTLSSKAISYLRSEIGFQGIIISDSLVMGGVLKQAGSVEEAAILAFQAGCDLLILSGDALVDGERVELSALDVKRVHAALVHALRRGRISEERLDEAFQRILQLKKRLFCLDL
jgi:beta-N-acetylhexosaminidase